MENIETHCEGLNKPPRKNKPIYGDVGTKYFGPLKRFLAEYYNITKLDTTRTKIFVFSDLDLRNQEFTMGKKSYIFILRGDKYEICKLKLLS